MPTTHMAHRRKVAMQDYLFHRSGHLVVKLSEQLETKVLDEDNCENSEILVPLL